MHAVIRTFAGHAAKQLFDVLEARKQEVETLIRQVKGFVCYSLIRTTEGGVSVTVCEDKAGTDQSSQIARDWIGKNAADLGVNAPSIVEGSVILRLK
jgi:hypothetical protein